MEKSGEKLVHFRGITAINLDGKGRMAMPARYRGALMTDPLMGKLILTIDSEENCLLLYPINTWEEIEQKLENLSSFNQITRRIQRLLIGHATELEMDNNGRILLPALLREYASIDKQLILLGQGKRFELWSKASWENGCKRWLEHDRHDPANLLPELQMLSL